ncbi:hypothetical protein [Candidatus Vondammii sp. HM_W22]|uniref:hypothetical protein n=1 Tax=Candidatus Vondammii sp. HM_W22 TaxID=2687299 RepID=UPI001F13A545|nr:hypothetical protein [Candidatus Vondammii sp. HM_W22]
MNVYFADPYSPLATGLPMRIPMGYYVITFLKESIGEEITDLILSTVVEKLNNRPRKCLNYQTPNEVFLKSTGGAFTT